MNYFLKTFLSAGLLFSSASFLFSQAKTDTTIAIMVKGVCEQCKDRIEKAAKGRGVTTATWDVDSKMLSLTYNPSKTNVSKVEDRIAAAGHDTPLKTAEKADYEALPDCCHYRNLDAGSEHEEGHSMDHSSSKNNIQKHFSGDVFEEKSEGVITPLSGSSVIWNGSSTGTTTDSLGRFSLPENNTTDKIVVSYAGYKTDTITLRENEALHIILKPNNTLTAVTVTTTRLSMSVNTASAIRSYEITSKELLKAACCNLSESFETNPSVDVTYNDAVTGSKQIQLLGLAGNYTQLTVESLPGPRGLATPLGLNSIPGTWVDGIQLIKGTGSVVNGFESIAGQINVELKKPDNSDHLYANMYYNQFGKTDLNINLTRKINNKWSTALLLHDAFAHRKADMNTDGFRDFPNGNLFSGIHRWSYANGKGLFAQFGVKYLKDEKIGGEVDFDPAKHKLSTQHYGLEINIARKELFGKIGYVFPGKPYKSVGLQLAAVDHTQDSYFGLTTYNGNQKSLYANLIYQSIISHTGHKFKTGLSFLSDKYNEDFNLMNYQRKEAVPGAFFEYTFKPSEKFDLVAGIRGDHNSLYGFFASPRLNVRYEPVEGTTIRVSGGRGQRTANIFAENNSVLVSARQVKILQARTGKAYGLDPEVSWNKGISVDQKLRMFNRSSLLSFDFFRNDFSSQVVVDLENPRQVKFYNLQGKSYSNSFQTEWSMEPLQHLNVRLAYRLFDVKTDYSGTVLQKPLISKHRAFANFGYEAGTWKFDYTFSYNGKKRLPSTANNPSEFQLGQYSPGYVVMNSQVTKTFGSKMPVDIYAGMENLGNFTQKNPIEAASQPFNPYFDASMIWGPINGRMVYAGLRFKIK